MDKGLLKLFFSGIGGSGMSAIAGFMADKGHSIVGSDRAFDSNGDCKLSHLLQTRGIKIVPHNGSGINENFDYVIFSTAVEHTQPEYLAAKSLGLKIKNRPEYLIDITKNFKTTAVAGTSGKSTTSGLLAFLMQKIGLEPNFIGGGRVKNLSLNSHIGNYIAGSSDLMVIEACESDGTIVDYSPQNSILLNLQLDHHSIEKTSSMFEKFLQQTSAIKIINADDLNLKKLKILNPISFSIDSPSDYEAENITYLPFSSSFTVNKIRFKLSLPGKYNIYNALAAIAMLSEMGVPLKDIAHFIPLFSGIQRRFDIHFNTPNHLVIDDFAHNPHKISCLMQTVSKIKDRICYIFQPHGYAPTKLMKDGYIETFATCLRESDHLILLPIYFAGGNASKDISSDDIAKSVRARGKSVQAVRERKEILDRLSEWQNFVIFGARDDTLSDLAKDIAALLNPNHPI